MYLSQDTIAVVREEVRVTCELVASNAEGSSVHRVVKVVYDLSYRMILDDYDVNKEAIPLTLD